MDYLPRPIISKRSPILTDRSPETGTYWIHTNGMELWIHVGKGIWVLVNENLKSTLPKEPVEDKLDE